MYRTALIALLLLASGSGSAQSARQRRDSLKAVIATQRLSIARADSMRDTSSAVLARIALSALVNPKEGRHFLEQAALLAEEADDLPLAIKAREGLAALYSASGAHRSAHEELARVARLTGLRSRADSLVLAAAYENVIAAQQSAHAAETKRLRSELQGANEEAEANRTIADRWLLAASGIGIAWALTIVGLFVALSRHRKARDRLANEVYSLRSRVAELARAIEGMVTRTERQAAQAAPPAAVMAPPVTAGAAPASAAVHDPMVLALFRRQAPERISTLQGARAAGDHEKVLRVLHSLRPQLDALDPGGLGALCADLRAMEPSSTGRDSGLDQLITGMNALLARS